MALNSDVSWRENSGYLENTEWITKQSITWETTDTVSQLIDNIMPKSILLDEDWKWMLNVLSQEELKDLDIEQAGVTDDKITITHDNKWNIYFSVDADCEVDSFQLLYFTKSVSNKGSSNEYKSHLIIVNIDNDFNS